MKEYRIMILLVSTLFIIAISCSSQLDNEDFSDTAVDASSARLGEPS